MYNEELLYITKSLMGKIIIFYFAKVWKGREKTYTHGYHKDLNPRPRLKKEWCPFVRARILYV